MDLMSLVVGIGLGLVVGGGALFAVATALARAKFAAVNAAAQTALDAARHELEPLRIERDRLRSDLTAALASEASAKAMHAAAQTAVEELRARVELERSRAEQESRLRAKTQEELRAADERMTEREHAMKRVLDEREKSLLELKASVEQSRTQLTDVFKAAGADVLKSTAESLLKQAKDQFEGQKQLSSQELEARQKAIDATIAPLKEQLAKQEALVKQLSEKTEGESKTLGEKLRMISDLQVQASSAAEKLSSALRDNRQRGQWGEVALRNIAEMAGLVDNVDFEEQSGAVGEEGNRLRPDMTVRLPGGRFVPIDAKVPMLAYMESLNPGLSDAERADRRAAHAQALRSHVRALASREYAKAMGEGVEITVLFVPLESGLIAALEEDGSIYREALDSRVVICTSSTLLALLRTCAIQWQQAKLNENARKIGENSKDLLDRISKFAEHLEKVGSGLTSAAKSYNAAVGSFNTRLLPSARNTAELAGELELAPEELSTTEESVREVAQVSRALPEA